MEQVFQEIISGEEELRAIMGHPGELSLKKEIPLLDEHCKAFIAHSPFMLIASTNTDGQVDISPKGDPAGFVQVLDDKTLAIPDRPGNRRFDTLSNILQNEHVGLIFMIPYKSETLRVSGTAKIVRDTWLLEQMAIKGKLPHLAIVVNVEKAYMHCAKCIIRSELWDSSQDLSGLASLSQVLKDHTALALSLEELDDLIDDSYTNRLY